MACWIVWGKSSTRLRTPKGKLQPMMQECDPTKLSLQGSSRACHPGRATVSRPQGSAYRTVSDCRCSCRNYCRTALVGRHYQSSYQGYAMLGSCTCPLQYPCSRQG